MTQSGFAFGAIALLALSACGPKAETAAPAETTAVETVVVEEAPAVDAAATEAAAAATDAAAPATDAAAEATDAAAAAMADGPGTEDSPGNTGPDKNRK